MGQLLNNLQKEWEKVFLELEIWEDLLNMLNALEMVTIER